MTEQLDVVVRFHDVRRLRELTRCVFSLVGQSYRPLNIILTLQRFSAEDIAATRTALEPFMADDAGVQLTVVNWDQPEPVDARSVLLNLGVRAAQGRYLAYLDYDDVLYPEAYELMVGRLKTTGAAIAFGAVRVMRLNVYDQFFYTEETVITPFHGKDLIDLIQNNFCPLHSYVIDRLQLPADILTFNTTLTLEEDYDVLLRICAAHRSDFALIATQIGDYYYKTDGSNTVPTVGGLPLEEYGRFEKVRATIEHRRKVTMVVPAVQRALGLGDSGRPLSIRDVIDRLPASRLR